MPFHKRWGKPHLLHLFYNTRRGHLLSFAFLEQTFPLWFALDEVGMQLSFQCREVASFCACWTACIEWSCGECWVNIHGSVMWARPDPSPDGERRSMSGVSHLTSPISATHHCARPSIKGQQSRPTRITRSTQVFLSSIVQIECRVQPELESSPFFSLCFRWAPCSAQWPRKVAQSTSETPEQSIGIRYHNYALSGIALWQRACQITREKRYKKGTKNYQTSVRISSAIFRQSNAFHLQSLTYLPRLEGCRIFPSSSRTFPTLNFIEPGRRVCVRASPQPTKFFFRSFVRRRYDLVTITDVILTKRNSSTCLTKTVLLTCLYQVSRRPYANVITRHWIDLVIFFFFFFWIKG